jgi:glycine cleavage system H protein
VGDNIAGGDQAGVVESVKAASDIYSPLSGEVLAVNESLEDEPELVNSDPYNDGWFFRLQPDDLSELEGLMSADEYQSMCDEDDA